MGNLLDALGVNFKMVIIQAVGFLFLLLLLKKFLFGKIKDMIKARADEIKETYKKSEDDRTEAGKLKESYQKKVVEAEKQAEEKIQVAVVNAKELGDGIVSKSHTDAEEIMSKARLNIDLERKKALAEVRNQVIDLTVYASARLIQQSINHGTAEKLVDDVISEVERLS
ncbi:MAG: F0F1 ATP synthase subunit B [Planctomycetota bacterium]